MILNLSCFLPSCLSFIFSFIFLPALYLPFPLSSLMSFLHLSIHFEFFLLCVFPSHFLPVCLFSVFPFVFLPTRCFSFPLSSCVSFLCPSIRLPSYEVFFPSTFLLDVFSVAFHSSSPTISVHLNTSFVATNMFVTTNMCLSQNLSWQKYFVTTKLLSRQIFVPTNIILLQQKFCHSKHTFVAAKDVGCYNKHMFVVTKVCMSRQTFVMTKLCLSWQIFVTTRQKWYLWQHPPMILLGHLPGMTVHSMLVVLAWQTPKRRRPPPLQLLRPWPPAGDTSWPSSRCRSSTWPSMSRRRSAAGATSCCTLCCCTSAPCARVWATRPSW